jgi:hypothetical protein
LRTSRAALDAERRLLSSLWDAMSTTNLNRRAFNNFDCVVADHNSPIGKAKLFVVVFRVWLTEKFLVNEFCRKNV